MRNLTIVVVALALGASISGCNGSSNPSPTAPTTWNNGGTGVSPTTVAAVTSVRVFDKVDGSGPQIQPAEDGSFTLKVGQVAQLQYDVFNPQAQGREVGYARIYCDGNPTMANVAVTRPPVVETNVGPDIGGRVDIGFGKPGNCCYRIDGTETGGNLPGGTSTFGKAVTIRVVQ